MTPAARERLRATRGYRPEERVRAVTVGGSGVGESLLRRVLDAVPLARRRPRPALCGRDRSADRFHPVASDEGRHGAGYLPDLYQHLAACAVAVVQGGLTTGMELAAANRPFL